MFDEKFVNEVIRIIVKEIHYSYLGRINQSVVLVSDRFLAESKEKFREQRQILEYNPVFPKDLFLRGAFMVAVPWLSDYEFEIRPKV